ncbi:hypothetical protein MTO96_038435 [Rhipicephalus appendiculatus]
MPGVTISASTVDRLLDAHSYSVKLVTQRPADHNRADVKHSRKLYAQWLQSDEPRVCRFCLDETNYNIWCSRNFGRTTKGQPAVHTTTTTKGANLNIIACMSANGVIHWTAVDRVHWAVFNDFLSDVSALVERDESNTEAVFIFDGAPAHTRAEQAALANSLHSIKRLPAYSPFFNPIEEVFSKFKSHVKAYLSERRDLVLTTPQGMTKKEHRRSLLLDAARHSMQQIQRVDCAAFDRHNFSVVPADACVKMTCERTKWCGRGNVAKHYNDLGRARKTDKCCREHDHSSPTIPAEQSRNGINNNLSYTMTNCADDRKFFNCLLKANTATSRVIGYLYFDFLKTPCFEDGLPEKCTDFNP